MTIRGHRQCCHAPTFVDTGELNSGPFAFIARTLPTVMSSALLIGGWDNILVHYRLSSCRISDKVMVNFNAYPFYKILAVLGYNAYSHYLGKPRGKVLLAFVFTDGDIGWGNLKHLLKSLDWSKIPWQRIALLSSEFRRVGDFASSINYLMT